MMLILISNHGQGMVVTKWWSLQQHSWPFMSPAFFYLFLWLAIVVARFLRIVIENLEAGGEVQDRGTQNVTKGWKVS
jgi:hypothetical protein